MRQNSIKRCIFCAKKMHVSCLQRKTINMFFPECECYFLKLPTKISSFLQLWRVHKHSKKEDKNDIINYPPFKAGVNCRWSIFLRSWPSYSFLASFNPLLWTSIRMAAKVFRKSLYLINFLKIYQFTINLRLSKAT